MPRASACSLGGSEAIEMSLPPLRITDGEHLLLPTRCDEDEIHLTDSILEASRCVIDDLNQPKLTGGSDIPG